MKCARVASESSVERRGRPSGAPAACVGGRAAGGGARRPSHPPPHDECRHPLPPAAIRRPCRSLPYDATFAALAAHRRTTPRLHDTACRTPHDAWRSPPPATPSAPFAPAATSARHRPLLQFCLPRDVSPTASYLSRDPPLQSFTCRTASPAATFCRSATSLPVPRLSQSKRMAIYQRNARSGETAGAKTEKCTISNRSLTHQRLRIFCDLGKRR